MGKIEALVYRVSLPVLVVRREAPVVGLDGRAQPGAELRATVRLDVQPAGGSQLARELEGDGVTGAVAVRSSSTALAEAFADGDILEAPLGWTTLRVCQPRGEDGPPGDLLHWQGRIFEIAALEVWDAHGLIADAGLRVYRADERRAA